MDGNEIPMMIPDNCRGRAEGGNGLSMTRKKQGHGKQRQSQLIIIFYNQG